MGFRHPVIVARPARPPPAFQCRPVADVSDAGRRRAITLASRCDGSKRAAQWPPSPRVVFGDCGLCSGLDRRRRFAVQCFAQRMLDDPRHLAPKIELVPSCVDRRHALASMREQRADPFERVARPVQDRCGGPPKVVRRRVGIPSRATMSFAVWSSSAADRTGARLDRF
jgi:hypothetical protein